MTDNEIIKAAECCVFGESCEGCPLEFKDCANIDVSKLTLDLINRQKAEIEELETEIDKQYEQAKADILGNMADGGVSCHWCIEEHRANAIKEFAERLTDLCYKEFGSELEVAHTFAAIVSSVRDNLVKEMVGAE